MNTRSTPLAELKNIFAGLTATLMLSGGLVSGAAYAALDIADIPLFLGGGAPPLNLLVMGRDHKLYHEAYNDASDLTGDGVPDVGYKPGEIDYFGYFDSYKCYIYSPPNDLGGRFIPVRHTSDKRCPGPFWSGDWLNYLTTARIDALRKILYGGKRVVDSPTETVLERSFIPQDAHSWARDYESVARDGYHINDYTPFSLPASGMRHLFGNTTLRADRDDHPRLRVLQDVPLRKWNWASIQRPVLGDRVIEGTDGPRIGRDAPVENARVLDFSVRVQVCVASMPEDNCQRYPSGAWRPTGLLNEFGESGQMLFGLLTGSFDNNLQGGVLRRPIGSIAEEINPETGQLNDTIGIIRSIDSLRIAGFTGPRYEYRGGFLTRRPMQNGEFIDWGNPIAEMMYEGLRYFSGRGEPTPEFSSPASAPEDTALGLPRARWDKPLERHPACSPAAMTVISDINPSFDTEFLPGSAFSSFAGDLPGLDVTSIGDRLWANEYGEPGQHFIGQVGTTYDGAPTAKTVSSFGNIRGLAPENPTMRGGYYAASVAHFGHTTDLLPEIAGRQTVSSYFVALASPLPRIEIPVAGSLVTLVPFAKSVEGFGIDGGQGRFQPTNQIVDFYVDHIVNTSPSNKDSSVNEGRPYGRFRINFEDVEQGGDYDMDAIVIYEFRVTGDDRVEIQLISEYAAGRIQQHMGYVISGTTADGVYLEVRDCDTANPDGIHSHPSVAAQCRGNSPANVFRYFLSTPPGALPGECAISPRTAACDSDLPLFTTRTFTPSGTATATLLRDPLWYAAKYGGFADSDSSGMPSQPQDWDSTGDGNPDNYFLVTNALTLGDQLSTAFSMITSRVTTASAVATNSTRLDTESLIYQARFRSDDWTGRLIAYRLNDDGSLGTVQWDTGSRQTPFHRQPVYTMNSDRQGILFRWSSLSPDQRQLLAPGEDIPARVRQLLKVSWLQGDQSQEQASGGPFRNRTTTMGTIVNSDPVFVGAMDFGYEALPTTAHGQDSYREFVTARIGPDRQPLHPTLYVGANDGMLHALDASTGETRFRYIPSTLISDLYKLTRPDYRHRYYVDGDIFVGDAFIDGEWRRVLVGATGAGGRTVFALDVTNPEAFGPEHVLWEFSSKDDPDLGYTIGKPSVARMANGQWVAIFANGYNSDSQQASLFVVDLRTGALVRKIATEAGSFTQPNGLSTPALLADVTRTITAAYAGDLLGNLWKFDLSSRDPNQWRVAYSAGAGPQPLFVARDQQGERQPIQAPIELGQHPDGGIMAFFGTGRYLGFNDIMLRDAQIQTFYGIRDNGSGRPVTQPREAALSHREIMSETVSGNFQVRVTSKGDETEQSTDGWFLDLLSPREGVEGERVVNTAILRNGRIIFTTVIPSQDICEFGGSSWLMELEAFSGNRFTQPMIDLNEDMRLDEGDTVWTVVDGRLTAVPASGIRSRVGIIRQPAIIAAGPMEYKLASGISGGVEILRERGATNRARSSWRQMQ